MKKLILTLAIALSATFGLSARDAGYRGFVDLGYAFSVSELKISTPYGDYTTDISNRLLLSTTHGYQFNPYFFAGAGLGMTYWHQSSDRSIGLPIYADFRCDIPLDCRFSPFFDVKLGYSLIDIEGLYFNPQVGVRCYLDDYDTIGLNLGVGYQLQTIKNVSGYCGAISLKLGIDF